MIVITLSIQNVSKNLTGADAVLHFNSVNYLETELKNLQKMKQG